MNSNAKRAEHRKVKYGLQVQMPIEELTTERVNFPDLELEQIQFHSSPKKNQGRNTVYLMNSNAKMMRTYEQSSIDSSIASGIVVDSEVPDPIESERQQLEVLRG